MQNILPYNPFPTFIFRTPLFPFNVFINILDEESICYEKLKSVIQQTVVAEALFLASPELYEQLKVWANGNNLEFKDNERFNQTIYKYLSRMSSRCTPFGLFAGCGVGKFGNETSVRLKKASEYERHTRLDMLYLCKLSQALAKNDIIKYKIRFFNNNSLYKSGEKLRYIEYHYLREIRTHHLVEVNYNEILNLVVTEARKGKTINELVQIVIDNDISSDQAKDFISKLIDNQILISELDPTVTGDEYLKRIIKILLPIEGISLIKDTLYQANNKLYTIDKKIGNSPTAYYSISSDLEKLGVEYNMKYLFQTDLNVTTTSSLVSERTLDSIKICLILLNKLTVKNTNTKISQFIEAFTNRYEMRECSLLNVLDTETGIGYLQTISNSPGDVSPIISDISLPTKEINNSKLEWNRIQEFLLKKILETYEKGLFEIDIKEDELDSFEINWDDIPASIYAIIKFVEGNSQQYPEGRIQIENVGGNTATQLLGRFCHGNRDVFDIAKKIALYEQNLFHESILAEIVHLPDSRVGNVILRPVLQEYEIPFLASPAVDSEHTIYLDDLYVSVRNNEIILRSKSLKKRVIPRLSSAHNYSSYALPAYQFLCDLQSQNMRSYIGFTWGNLSNSYSFRPRVIYRNLIISPASWVVQKEEIGELLKIIDDKQLMLSVTEWRLTKRMPELVLLEQGDNTLFVSFKSLLSVRTLFASVKNNSAFTLKEFLFNVKNAVVKNGDGVFTNEFVFAFYKNVEKYGTHRI